jgi:hypothetical protein
MTTNEKLIRFIEAHLTVKRTSQENVILILDRSGVAYNMLVIKGEKLDVYDISGPVMKEYANIKVMDWLGY